MIPSPIRPNFGKEIDMTVTVMSKKELQKAKDLGILPKDTKFGDKVLGATLMEWKPLAYKLILLLTIFLTSGICYALTPAQTAVFQHWLDPNGVGDFTGDGICNFQDFALAAGRKRDFINKAVIWGKWQGTDANDHSTSHKVCLQNFATYIAESNSIVKVNRKERTIMLKNLYAQLWMEWN